MPTEQEVLEHLQEHGLPKDFSSKLRDDLEAANEERNSFKDKADLYDKAQRRPLIEQALKDSKVDTSKLRKSDWEVLEAKTPEELTSEWAGQMAADYELPTGETETPATDLPAAAQMAAQAAGATGITDADAGYKAAKAAAKTPEELRKVLADHGGLAED